MKAYEFSTHISSDGKIELPEYLKLLTNTSEARVIVLLKEATDTTDDEGFSVESFRTSWQQAVTGQTLPLSQLWEGIEVD
jgi:hypothetical protein